MDINQMNKEAATFIFLSMVTFGIVSLFVLGWLCSLGVLPN